jgi:two-component system, NtrC family, sensor histidine kinase HydH
MQREMAHLLPGNVNAVEQAQRLEIQLRELRFLLLQQRLNPTNEVRRGIDAAHAEIEKALAASRSTTRDLQQTQLVNRIEHEYRDYRAEETESARKFTSLEEISRWAVEHPVAEAAEPCRKLLEINNREMRDAVAASDRSSRWVQAGLLLLCVLGPISGFVGGFGIARGLHRSISRMLVLVRDEHANIDEEVGLLDVDAVPSLNVLDERLQRFVERVREVTKRVQQQQQEILRTEQLAAVGQLAAGVAHEIRNPLMGMKLLVESARRNRGRAELSGDDLEVIHREILRLERTAQGLLDFARPPQLHTNVGDLRQAVFQAVELTRPRARLQEVDLELHIPEEPVLLPHDVDQVAGVITNLVFNSLDALPAGGKIAVTLKPRREGGADVAVRDNGPGISPDMLPKLFTPFLSTRPTGTGLGLSISRRTARQHGGDLMGRNEPGGGATFILSLPAAASTTAKSP